MFASIGRRLALLNAVVVIAVIAISGVVTFVLLRQSLDREADSALAERAEAATRTRADLFTSSQAIPGSNPPASVAEQPSNGSAQESPDHENGASEQEVGLLES